MDYKAESFIQFMVVMEEVKKRFPSGVTDPIAEFQERVGFVRSKHGRKLS